MKKILKNCSEYLEDMEIDSLMEILAKTNEKCHEAESEVKTHFAKKHTTPKAKHVSSDTVDSARTCDTDLYIWNKIKNFNYNRKMSKYRNIIFIPFYFNS